MNILNNVNIDHNPLTAYTLGDDCTCWLWLMIMLLQELFCNFPALKEIHTQSASHSLLHTHSTCSLNYISFIKRLQSMQVKPLKFKVSDTPPSKKE